MIDIINETCMNGNTKLLLEYIGGNNIVSKNVINWKKYLYLAVKHNNNEIISILLKYIHPNGGYNHRHRAKPCSRTVIHINSNCINEHDYFENAFRHAFKHEYCDIISNMLQFIWINEQILSTKIHNEIKIGFKSACEKKNKEIFEILLDHYLNEYIDQNDKYGKKIKVQALSKGVKILCKHNNVDFIKILIYKVTHKGNVHPKYHWIIQNSLYYACKYQNVDTFMLLINIPHINLSFNYNSLIKCACGTKNIKVINILLKKFADSDKNDYDYDEIIEIVETKFSLNENLPHSNKQNLEKNNIYQSYQNIFQQASSICSKYIWKSFNIKNSLTLNENIVNVLDENIVNVLDENILDENILDENIVNVLKNFKNLVNLKFNNFSQLGLSIDTNESNILINFNEKDNDNNNEYKYEYEYNSLMKSLHSDNINNTELIN